MGTALQTLSPSELNAHKKHVYPNGTMIREIMRLDREGFKATEIVELLHAEYAEVPSVYTVRTCMPSSSTYDKAKVELRLKHDKMWQKKPSEVLEVSQVSQPLSATVEEPEEVRVVWKVSAEVDEYVRACGILLGIDSGQVFEDLVHLAKKVGALNVHDGKQ